MKVLIKNGLVIDPKNNIKKIKDVLLVDNVIVKIEEKIKEEADVYIDASTYIVSPGFVDIHTNFCDPGMTEREDLKTGSMMAAKSGYTTIVLGVENKPQASECNVIDYINNFSRMMPVNLYPVAALTEDREGEELSNLKFLYSHDAIGFFDGTREIKYKYLLENALEIIRSLNVPISIYSFDRTGVKIRGINENKFTEKNNIKNAEQNKNEYEDLKENLEIINEYQDVKVNFTGISTEESLHLLKQAKKKNKNIFVDVPILNILCNDKMLEYVSDIALMKMLPPIRTENDRKSIISALSDGTIDIISSYHMPTTIEEKQVKLKDAKEGASTLESVLGICGKVLVESKALKWNDVIEKITINPSRLYGLDKEGIGSLDINKSSDITIFDPNEQWVLTEENMISKSKNTPIIGASLLGKVKMTIVDGRMVYKDVDMNSRISYEEDKENDDKETI